MELKDLQRLAIAQALFKAIKTQVATGNPDNLRGQADAWYKDMYNTVGVKSMDIKINNQVVGTYSMTKRTTKAKTEITIHNIPALQAWIAQNTEELNAWMQTMYGAFATWCFETYGEVPDGCEIVAAETASETLTPTLKVDEKKVAEATRGELPPEIVGLLEEEKNGSSH